MSVNKFGQFSMLEKATRNTNQPLGFNITKENNISFNLKRLVNVANPKEDNDVCGKKYIELLIKPITEKLTKCEKLQNKYSNDISNFNVCSEKYTELLINPLVEKFKK